MTPQPLNSEPPQGPVEGRGVAEIRADLACCDRDGVPWQAAARRLLGDVPSLLAEVEAAHRFEQSAAVERDALLGERDSLRGVVQAVEALAKDPVHECGETCEAWGCDAKGATYYVTLPKLHAALAAAADAPKPEDEPTKCAACGRPKNAHSPTRTGGYLTGHRFIDPKDVCHHTIEEGCTGHGGF